MKTVVRLVVGLAVIIVVAVLLVFLASLFAIAVLGFSHLLGLERALGIDTQESKNYDLVSGSGPIIVTAVGFSSILVTGWHHLNCHQDGCWRIGRYSVAGGKYKTCKSHHPDPIVKEGVQASHLLAAHEKHQKQ